MSITRKTDSDAHITTYTGADLRKLQDDLARAQFGELPPEGHCVACKQAFSDQNVHTAAGWAETQLSRMCEDCWDKMAAELDGSGEPGFYVVEITK